MNIRIGDFDPNVAPTKTAQDLHDAFLRFCQMNDRISFGFTRKEINLGSRTDANRIRLLVDQALLLGHLVERDGRLYPQASLFVQGYVDIMGPAVVVVEPHGGQYRHLCSWDGPSSTKWDTEEEAEAKLVSRKHHRDREAHSLKRSAVRG